MKFYIVEDRIYAHLREAKAYALLLADERCEQVAVDAYDIDMPTFRQYLKDTWESEGWSYPPGAVCFVQPSKKPGKKRGG